MSSYSELFIGKLYLPFRNYVPSFLTFLFEQDDLYSKWDKDNECFDALGYKTSCAKSIRILNRFGYTLDSFTEVYEFFHEDLKTSFENWAKDSIADSLGEKRSEELIDRRFAKYIKSFPPTSRLQELEDFGKFLGALLRTDFSSPPFDEQVTIQLQDGREYSVDSEQYLRSNRHRSLHFIDFESLQMYVRDKHLKFPPWISMLCRLFDDDYFFEYPEILSLMFVRLALESSRKRAQIRLELSDVIEEEQEARDLHAELAHSLVEKVQLYNRVLRTLFKNESSIREQYVKTQCRDLLRRCDRDKDPGVRGRLFERLTELLFTANGLLSVVDKRVSTGDEEIDIVVKNNIDRPFWIALGSPLLFVECKNWARPVGTKELRDFETKLRNHGSLVRVGFLLALNGFTKQVGSELKRMSRDETHVVIIARADIEEFLSGDGDFFSWAESRISELH